MPYIRYRGPYAVLVHSVRKGSRVVQRHLAYLGRRTGIEAELRRRVEADYPDIEFDWEGLESRLQGGRVKRASTWLEED
jgi:hypothetical protein